MSICQKKKFETDEEMKRINDSKDSVSTVLELPYLPLELWGEILGYLRLRDIAPCSSVCLTWERADLINKSLFSLNEEECRLISYKRMQRMVNLFSLQLDDGKHRQFDFTLNLQQVIPGLNSLVNLRALDLSFTKYIGNETIQPLTNLTTLAFEQSYITGDALIRLPCLKTLWLGYLNTSMTTESLGQLTNLTDLFISPMKGVKYDSIRHLTNLQKLHFIENSRPEVNTINDELLGGFANLVELILENNNTITGKGLQTLSKLEALGLYNNATISTNDINELTTLRNLTLDYRNGIYLNDLNKLIVVYIDVNDVDSDD